MSFLKLISSHGLTNVCFRMMEALDRVDRYEEAYEMLVSEIVQLGLGEDELDRLQAMSEKTLGVSTAKQKMKYVEEVKVEMDNIADVRFLAYSYSYSD